MDKFVYLPTLRFYRRLLKTMMKTFQGDYNMFHHCRIQAKEEIRRQKDLRDPVEIQEQIFIGEENRNFMEVNVMQGTYQPNGTPRLKARKEHCIGSNIKDGSVN